MKIKTIKYVFLFCIINLFSQSQNLYFPPTTGSVWDSILPSSLNYCQDRIDSLYNYLQAKNSKSFILLKDGKRVLEKYFGTYTQDSIHYWASAGKSLTGFITGVAQQKGYININNPASQYLGTGWSSAPLAKENLITVKNLITMTSGLDDAPPTPCDNEDTAKSCLIYKADAGTRWAYHSGAYRKTQDVISNAVGQTYNFITNIWIESKTGMSGFWFQQVYYSKARDMARFGLLTLNKGIWNTDTIMKDTAYYKAMINSSQNFNESYGYLWWLNGKNSFMVPGYQMVFNTPFIPNAPNDMYCALGKNDQKIYIVPSKNIVVVRQGNTAGPFSLAVSDFDDALWDYINKLDCATSSISEDSFILNSIFPNPITSYLNINNQNLNINNVKVYDIYGKIIFNSNIYNSTLKIDLTNVEKGIYIVELEQKNRRISRTKFIKE
jgi:CubicO group peptidase (beta-lactamase class C family)